MKKSLSILGSTGSIPWCFALTYLGFILGNNWLVIREYGHYLDILGGLAILAFIGKIIWDYYHNGNGD
jgi:membrane protein DedA with SNARE-associated domain